MAYKRIWKQAYRQTFTCNRTRLKQHKLFQVLYGGAQTNMVHIALPEDQLTPFIDFMQIRSIKIRPSNPLRLVFHLDIDDSAVADIIRAFGEFNQ